MDVTEDPYARLFQLETCDTYDTYLTQMPDCSPAESSCSMAMVVLWPI